MDDMKISVAGGTMEYKFMNKELSERIYELAKVGAWKAVIQELYARPVKWKGPYKKGTKMDFELIKTKEEADKAIDEFKAYFLEKNKTYQWTAEDGEELKRVITAS